MVRALGFGGLIVGFLSISGKFRGSAWGIIAGSVTLLEQYSPFSYVGLVAGIVLGFLIFVRTGSSPR